MAPQSAITISDTLANRQTNAVLAAHMICSAMITRLVGTNRIHDFTTVTFSVKLAVFRENAHFHEIAWNLILAFLLSFMKVFRVLSFNSFCVDSAVC